jgi:CRISPR-associated protein (TIGR02584 family)
MNTMSTPRLPHQYKRRILLLVSGLSPQIVTETLYALRFPKESEPFVPTEVHLISTSTGADQARLNLLTGPRHFHQLCMDYDLDESIFTPQCISVIQDAQGRELADIRTPEENEATGDFIAAKVREFTLDEEAALHVSMAGGRKTMGYYAGYALSLFGRSQDRLSHVLVEEGYEGLKDFYYTTPTSHTIYDRDKKALDAAKANISLAEIPFVRLREGLPAALLEGTRSFKDVIARSQLAEATPALCLDVPNRTIVCQGLKVPLSEADFAFYAWFVERTVTGEQSKPIAGQEVSDAVQHVPFGKDLLAMYERIIGNQMKMDDRVSEALQNGMTRNYLDSKVGEIKKKLEKELGNRLALTYCIRNANKNKKGNSLYAVWLEKNQVTWKWR